MNYDAMPLSERLALLRALMTVYQRGGNGGWVLGQQMTRAEIVKEALTVKASIEATNAILASCSK